MSATSFRGPSLLASIASESSTSMSRISETFEGKIGSLESQQVPEQEGHTLSKTQNIGSENERVPNEVAIADSDDEDQHSGINEATFQRVVVQATVTSRRSLLTSQLIRPVKSRHLPAGPSLPPDKEPDHRQKANLNRNTLHSGATHIAQEICVEGSGTTAYKATTDEAGRKEQDAVCCLDQFSDNYFVRGW